MLLFVGGPAGSGKSSVGLGLAEKLEYPFLEGDSYHPPANVDKMARGIPLTDDDRWDWLDTLATEGSKVAAERGNCIVSCSALKKVYRDRLRSKAKETETAFVILDVDAPKLLERVRQREGHFMKADMIESQLAILELPKSDEPDAITFITTEDVDSTINGVYKRAVEKWPQLAQR